LALFNSLPVSGLDGGEALRTFLSAITDPDRSEKPCLIISFLGVFILWLFTLYSLFYFNESFSLFFSSAYLFLSAVWHKGARGI